MTGISAAMTMDVDYRYSDIETAAAATAREQFNGVFFVDTPWEVAPASKVFELEKLLDNWDGHGSPRISWRTSTLALALIRSLARLGGDVLPQPFVGPVADGGIVLELERGHRELGVSVVNETATIRFLKSGVGEPFDEGEFRLPAYSELRDLVRWLMQPGG